MVVWGMLRGCSLQDEFTHDLAVLGIVNRLTCESANGSE
jgi:hypothetical protein